MDYPPAQPHSNSVRDTTETSTAEPPAERQLRIAVPANAPTLSPSAAARLLRPIRNVALESDRFADPETEYDEYGSRAA